MENFTKKAIQSRYLAMLDGNDPSEVTVRALVEACEMNRNTFYYHFRDLDDLLSASLSDWLSEKRKAGGMGDFLSGLAEHGTALLRLYESDRCGIMTDCLEEAVAQAARELVAARHGGSPRPGGAEELVDLSRALFSGLVLDWLNRGMNYDLGAVADRAWRRLTVDVGASARPER